MFFIRKYKKLFILIFIFIIVINLDIIADDSNIDVNEIFKIHSMAKNMPITWPFEDLKGTYIIRNSGIIDNPLTDGILLLTGIDIFADANSPVIATANGIIVDIRKSDSYEYEFGSGLTVEISHDYGFVTIYINLSEVFVNIGDEVIRGQAIGILCENTFLNEYFLHYKIKINSAFVSPEAIIIR